MRTLSTLLILLAAFGLFKAAAADGESPADTLTNRTCPVMIGTPVDAAKWIDHDGRRIYFCCDRCIRLFRENPDFYLANLETEAGGAAREELYPEWEGGAFIGRLIRFSGNLHPLAVHFPIAFAIAALVADILFLVRGEERWRETARFLLLGGALSVIAAIPLGYASGTGIVYPPEAVAGFGLHRLLGTVGGALLLAASGLREWAFRSGRPSATRASGVVLAAATALIVLAGYLGGVLVHGPGHFRW